MEWCLFYVICDQFSLMRVNLITCYCKPFNIHVIISHENTYAKSGNILFDHDADNADFDNVAIIQDNHERVFICVI